MKNRFIWAMQSIKTGVAVKSYEVNGEMVLGSAVDDVIFKSETLGEVIKHNKEVRVLRQTLCNAYVFTYYPKLNRIDAMGAYLLNEEYHKRFLEAQSIVNSCIGYKSQLIKTENSDELVYLTVEGKKFVGIDGLLKAEVGELGVLWGVIIWILSFTAANWASVKNLIMLLIKTI